MSASDICSMYDFHLVYLANYSVTETVYIAAKSNTEKVFFFTSYIFTIQIIYIQYTLLCAIYPLTHSYVRLFVRSSVRSFPYNFVFNVFHVAFSTNFHLSTFNASTLTMRISNTPKCENNNNNLYIMMLEKFCEWRDEEEKQKQSCVPLGPLHLTPPTLSQQHEENYPNMYCTLTHTHLPNWIQHMYNKPIINKRETESK